MGLVLSLYYGNRTLRSYRQVRFIQERGFDSGDADLDAIRPWMTIHFVASAYAVPKEFIFAELGVEAEKHRRDIDLKHLNEELRLGRSSVGPYPALIDRLREIILAYRDDPVVTGLRELRGWMTLEYIANGTGVPAATIINELDLEELAEKRSADEGSEVDVSVYRPLSRLAGDLRYPGGPRALEESIQSVLDNHISSDTQSNEPNPSNPETSNTEPSDTEPSQNIPTIDESSVRTQ